MFDRQIQTRVVCILLVLMWLAGVVCAIVFVADLVSPPIATAWRRFFWIAAVLFALASACKATLWIWRKCDRCKSRLFEEGRRSLLGSGEQFKTRQPWQRQNWVTTLALERPRDYRAKTLLGSYSVAVIAQTALSGSARCQWCGHMDGARLDYVVTVGGE